MMTLPPLHTLPYPSLFSLSFLLLGKRDGFLLYLILETRNFKQEQLFPLKELEKYEFNGEKPKLLSYTSKQFI